jgi:hypothetical protein
MRKIVQSGHPVSKTNGALLPRCCNPFVRKNQKSFYILKKMNDAVTSVYKEGIKVI